MQLNRVMTLTTLFAAAFAIAAAPAAVCAERAAAATAATQPSSSPAAEAHLWDMPEHGFKLTTPASWRQREQKDARVVLLLIPDLRRGAGKLVDIFTVTIVPLRDPAHHATLDEQAEAAKRTVLKDSPDAQFDPIEKTTLAGVEARRLSFTKTLDNKPAHTYRVIAMNNDRLYMIGYTCDRDAAGDGLKRLNGVLDTFQWQAVQKK